MTSISSPATRDENRLNYKQRLAGLFLMALASSGKDYAEIDAALGRSAGYTKRYFSALAGGGSADLNLMIDMADALGFKLHIRMDKTPEALAAQTAE